MNNYLEASKVLPGCCLIPVRRGTKIPAVVWQPYQERHPDLGEIGAWTTKFAKANVGCVTGVVSGVVVLDVDTKEALPGVLAELGLDGASVPITATPRGYHVWFKHPGNMKIPNSANAAKKMDLRGDGGYVVVPPSAIGEDKYCWLNPFNREVLPAFPIKWAATLFPAVATVLKQFSRI